MTEALHDRHPGPGALHWVLLALVLAWYLAFSLSKLDTVPPVREDEPWQASTGWSIATGHGFATDVFAGMHKREERYYGFMPIHPYALALTFRLFGLGLYQARLEAVVMGFAILVLTYCLARRLTNPPTAILALLLLVTVRITGPVPTQSTGILFLDSVRIARYDIVVPVMGLAALHVYLWAVERRRLALFALAGVLAAMSGLAHVYGAIWLVVLAVLAIYDRVGAGAIVALVAGFLAPWAIYGRYVLEDVDTWRRQMAIYAPRVDLLDVRFYLDNLTREPLRYGQGVSTRGWQALSSPGLWAAVVTMCGAVIWLATRARRGDRNAFVLLLPVVLFPVAYALLLTIKLPAYLLAVLPVAMIAAASAWVHLWRLPSVSSRRWRRAVCLIVLATVVAEGGYLATSFMSAAAAVTPYPQLAARLHTAIPPGSRVLGLHRYWLGFEDTTYRSWLVPWSATLESSDPPARSMEAALMRMNPEFVVVDPAMRETLARSPEQAAGVQRWLRERGATLADEFADPVYGRFEVYRAGKQGS